MTPPSLFRQTGLILRNDLRLLWRNYVAGRWRALGGIALMVLFLVLAHGVAFLVFANVRQPPPLQIEAAGWYFFTFFMLGAAMNTAIGLLYERADFDLLLSSPVSARAVLFARVATLGLSALFSVAFFLLPLLNGLTFFQDWRYAAGWLVWIFLAALCASLGVTLTLSLVRWLGIKRARIAVQVFAAVASALVFLVMQAPNLLPRKQGAAVFATLARLTDTPHFTWLARCARGEPLPLLVLGLVSVGAVALTLRRLSGAFISGSQDAGAVTSTRRASGRRYRWVDHFAHAVFRKDFRLIARDPLLLAQILPTAFYLIPGIFSFGRKSGIVLIAPIAVVIAAQFSLTLSAVAAAGEECWDLIRMSPAPELRLRVAKMLAGMALPLLLSFTICTVLAFAGHPWVALITAVAAVATAAPCAWLQVTNIQPTARRDVLRRRGGRSLVRGIISGLFIMVGAVSVGLIGHGQRLAGTLGLTLLVLAALACFTFVKPKALPSESAR